MGWVGVILVISCLVVITIPLKKPVRMDQKAVAGT